MEALCSIADMAAVMGAVNQYGDRPGPRGQPSQTSSQLLQSPTVTVSYEPPRQLSSFIWNTVQLLYLGSASDMVALMGAVVYCFQIMQSKWLVSLKYQTTLGEQTCTSYFFGSVLILS